MKYLENPYEIRGSSYWISDLGGFDVYEELPLGDEMAFKPGQFYNTHIKYPWSGATKVLELENKDPENESKTTFVITDYKKDSDKQSNFPIKSLNLRSTDRLYILAGKPRPVIVLGYVKSDWLENTEEEIILCLPISSFKYHHTPENILYIQGFNFSHLFYLKPVPKGIYYESAARFELIQPIQKDELRPITNSNKNPFKLSNYTFKLLINHLFKFLYRKPFDEDLEKELKVYSEILTEEIQKTYQEDGGSSV